MVQTLIGGIVGVNVFSKSEGSVYPLNKWRGITAPSRSPNYLYIG
jgi:hypothetical protein